MKSFAYRSRDLTVSWQRKYSGTERLTRIPEPRQNA